MVNTLNSEQERSFSILAATRCQSFTSTPHHIRTLHNKKVKDKDFLLPLPLLLPIPYPKHHQSCGKNSFPRCSMSLGRLRHQQSEELWQDSGWWHWGKMPHLQPQQGPASTSSQPGTCHGSSSSPDNCLAFIFGAHAQGD